jgi:hypothetical protein
MPLEGDGKFCFSYKKTILLTVFSGNIVIDNFSLHGKKILPDAPQRKVSHPLVANAINVAPLICAGCYTELK